MDTTNNDLPEILFALAGFVDLRNSNVLQMQESRDEVELEIDWLYSRAIWHGMTPAEIAEAVPGMEVQ